jgi:hypothetical protein
VELYLHFPVCFHGVALSEAQDVSLTGDVFMAWYFVKRKIRFMSWFVVKLRIHLHGVVLT